MSDSRKLVIVESPAKAKTIAQYLGEGYEVQASVGHIRDLIEPKNLPPELKKGSLGKFSIDVEGGFLPYYVVSDAKKRTVTDLKKALKEADELYLATDEDREGEAIAWHLLEVLKPKVPVKRMVFHEITKEAIEAARNNPRELDTALVDAQETRRILDRLFGFEISPVLWRKVGPGLSAGRVQSAATRLVVDRERERLAFISASYWDLTAGLAPGAEAEQAGKRFDARLVRLDGRRVASGRDFTDRGALKGEAVALDEKAAEALSAALKKDDARFTVLSVESKPYTRRPAAPFTTSTLQQEAGRKLRFTARQTMSVAQSLYENGYITYMRTDSPALSQQAIQAARAQASELYGADSIPEKPRVYTGKSKNAQEAHEAVRPSGDVFRTPAELASTLRGNDFKLYDLIWKRTVASQMADARLLRTRATILAAEGTDDESTFRANGQVIEFPGFFRAYVEGKDDPSAALDDRDSPLPALAVDDTPEAKAVDAVGHETKPPARYTDASLVQALEKAGVGRPSTYASIIDTVVRRGYVIRDKNQLVPTFTGMAVTNLLEKNFERLVDTAFTARMEEELDGIAGGTEERVPYLERFFNGPEGLEKRIEQGVETIDPREISTMRHAKWGAYEVRVGRYGPYAAAPDGSTASLPPEAAPADLAEADIAALIDANDDERPLGIHPTAEMPILLKSGPYGPYVQLGDDEEKKPKRTSLPKGTKPEDVDLDLAVQLLNLPRTLGDHPETGQPIKANIGRYGPYVQHERTFASLKPADGDNVLTVELERALELIAQKRQKAAPLRTLGAHPESGKPIDVFEGRYGPYVKHVKTNATIPKDMDKDEITLEQAVALVDAKASKPKKKRAPRKKAS